MAQVSVIIINYNTYNLTSACIASLYKFTKGIKFEIIVVDNASTECNPNNFLLDFPEIKLIINKQNVGFAAGNNIGIRSSMGEIILLLNSDIELHENSIGYCYNYLKSLGKSALVSCKLIYPNGLIQAQCGRFPSIVLNLLEASRLHKLFPQEKRAILYYSSYFDHLQYAEPDWLWGAFFMFNKNILEKLPGKELDQTYFMYFEDVQWCYDFKKLGIKCIYLPEVSVIHHLGSSSNISTRTKRINDNEALFLRRNYGRIYQVLFSVSKFLNKFLSKK